MNLIVKNGFWPIHIPFIYIGYFNLSHISQNMTFLNHLCLVSYFFVAFSYIRLVYDQTFCLVNTKPIFAIPLHIIYFRTNIIGLCDIALCRCWQRSFSLWRFSFHSYVRDFMCEISPICRMQNLYSYFSSHFYCLVFVVVLFAIMLSMLSLFTFFNVVLDSSYLCSHATCTT